MLGTTGKGSNCPTFANALKATGTIQFEPPNFDAAPDVEDKNQIEPAQTPSAETGCGSPPKIQKLPPIRSPQQQAGCQANLNRLVKQKQERARRRRGDLW